MWVRKKKRKKIVYNFETVESYFIKTFLHVLTNTIYSSCIYRRCIRNKIGVIRLTSKYT